MLTALLVAVGLLVLAVLAYRVRCAISPFGRRGRRRVYYWAGGWWRGDQARNRE